MPWFPCVDGTIGAASRMTRVAMRRTLGEASLLSRDIAIRRAFLSTFWTKAGTAVVQLASLPVAKRALELEAFAAYGVLATATAWFAFVNLGVGPGLAVEVAEAKATGNEASYGSLFATAAALASLLGAIVLAMATAGAMLIDANRLFGRQIAFGVPANDLILSLIIACWLAVAHSVLGVVDGFRLGMQQQHLNNRWAAWGQALSAVSIVAIAVWLPSLPAMFVAAFGPPVLSRAANGASLVRGDPHLRLNVRAVRFGLVPKLLHRNGAFTVVQLSTILGSQLSIVLVSRTQAVDVTSSFFILSAVAQMGYGILSAAMTPFTTAARDALASGDVGWAKETYSRLTKYSAVYVAVVFVVMTSLGPLVVELAYGADTRPSLGLVAVFGLLFAATSAEYIDYTTLVGIDDPWTPVRPFIVKTILTISLFWVIGSRFGASGFVLALLIPTITATIPYLHWRVGVLLQPSHESPSTI